MSTSRIVAIVPAAGRSARMGTAKQLLPVSGRPMLLGVIDALRGGGADELVLVTHSQLRDQLGELSPDVRFAINDDAGSAMINSVRIGMEAAGACDGYLVCPADAAGIAAGDVRRCVEAFRESPQCIVVAAHGQRRGHPLIFARALAEVVHSRACDSGLNRLARGRPEQVRVVQCGAAALTNVNTPDDYERLGPRA
jgi:CTP:molybdopterin cytidylyltransferase MocA